jgi:hypothetical protein
VKASEPQLSAEAQLRAAPPHALVATARRLLAERVGAQDVRLLLADYGLTVLQPVTHLPRTGPPASANEGPAGSAFLTQKPVLEVLHEPSGHMAHLPITVRGDRLGVLSVHLPAGAVDPHTVLQLGDFATALGHEVATAGRDTDLYLQARRTRRLTLAAEMQWQLLPGRGCAREEYVIGAHLEPAYAIGGDTFDWSTGADHLVLTVTDGMGQGIDASLLAGLTTGALRNARRAGIGLADQACLADQAVYAQYGGKAYASTLLLRFELATGLVHAVDAGSRNCSSSVAAGPSGSNWRRSCRSACSRRPSTRSRRSRWSPVTASSRSAPVSTAPARRRATCSASGSCARSSAPPAPRRPTRRHARSSPD